MPESEKESWGITRTTACTDAYAKKTGSDASTCAGAIFFKKCFLHNVFQLPLSKDKRDMQQLYCFNIYQVGL
jgi:hypothetical protein